MTNREKLIELLTEKDGMVDAEALSDLFDDSPLKPHCKTCCIGDCDECAAQWLNEEAKE